MVIPDNSTTVFRKQSICVLGQTARPECDLDLILFIEFPQDGMSGEIKIQHDFKQVTWTRWLRCSQEIRGGEYQARRELPGLIGNDRLNCLQLKI